MRTVTIWELAHELISAGVRADEVARKVGRNRATIYRWKKTIKYRGIRRFVADQKQAKRQRHRRCLDSRVVRLIKQSRTSHHDWCGEKIVWELNRLLPGACRADDFDIRRLKQADDSVPKK